MMIAGRYDDSIVLIEFCQVLENQVYDLMRRCKAYALIINVTFASLISGVFVGEEACQS